MYIAFCDDHEAVINQLNQLITEFDKETHTKNTLVSFSTPSELYAHMQTNKVDIIFMDLEFSDTTEDGIEWSKKIAKQFPHTIIIILTAYESRYKEGFVARAFRFMTKPIEEQELFDYLVAHDILPVGYMPLGSPRRPERDILPEDIADMQMPELVQIAEAHGCHPAIICLKWALQRGQLPIPFSVHNYEANLAAAVTEKLTDEEMRVIAALERGNRLVKGQVFLWEGARDWHDLWDEDGVIVDCTDC